MRNNKLNPGRASRTGRIAAGLSLIFSVLAFAQSPPALEQIVSRLERLERENAELRSQVAQLQTQIAALHTTPSVTPPSEAGSAPAPTVEERLDIAERRIEEQAATKLEASQRFPIRVSGMLLVNLFRNGPHSGGFDTPTVAAEASGRRTAGMTFRQSLLGFDYQGGQSLLGARVRGSLTMDFFEGLAESGNGYSPIRLRTASLGLDWSATSLSFGLEKPIFSPRDPNSFSYFGIAPLTGSGNLWRWQPQIRLEHRFELSGNDRIKPQIALMQTYEDVGADGSYQANLERRRPGLQGRIEYVHHFDDNRRFEIAPAFHVSSSHVGGASLPSRVFSLDWFANPWSHLEFSGAFYRGQNLHHLGALRQGYASHPGGVMHTVRSNGGWAQLAFPVTQRLTFNVFSGVHDDHNRDLYRGIAVNRTGAANVQYRIAPNVIVSVEAMQLRTTYFDTGRFKNNRYDLAVAYLF